MPRTTMELLFLVFAFHILSTLSVSALPGALQKRDLEKRQIPKPGKPFISGWVAAWLGQKSVELYQYYDELSFFSAVIDKTTLSVGWSIDGGPETVFPDNYIKDNYETQPILLTIGGWSGSMNFSQAIDTKEKRVTQAKAVTELVVKYGFSGVDLDWEFPNAVGKDERDFPGDVGMMCYAHSPDDTENLCLFIAELRAALEEGMKNAGMKYEPIITAAVPFSGFRGSDGQPLKDAYHFVQPGALDYISIMAHEMGHAYRTETGIHAPWKLGAKTPKDQQWYILKSIEYWTGANVPADKIQVGLASYGKTFNTTQPPGTKEPPVNTDYDSRLYQKQIPPEILEEPPAGWTNTWPSNTIWGREPCDIKHVRRVTEGLTYNQTIAANKLKVSGDEAGPGWEYAWDETTLSPYLWNPETAQMLTYDSPKSIAAEAKKIAEYKDANGKSLLGIKMFHVQGDYCAAGPKEANGPLARAARGAWA